MFADERRLSGTAGDGAPVTVRFAARRDTRGLERLAELDSGAVPTGPTLVAEVEGQLVAALPLGPGKPLADPFRPTAELLRVLELRETQLRGRDRRSVRRRFPRQGPRRPAPAESPP